MDFQIKRLQRIQNFSPVRAVAEVEYGGLLIRGLKLEERDGEFHLSAAGRKVNGSWQLVYELRNRDLATRLRDQVVAAYREELDRSA